MSNSLTNQAPDDVPDSIFYWSFEAASGNSWGGWLVLDSNATAPGGVVATALGRYVIQSEAEYGIDLSGVGLNDGEVHVEWYRLGGLGVFLPTRGGSSAIAGAGGLGSEVDQVWTGAAWLLFGLGGQFQVNSAELPEEPPSRPLKPPPPPPAFTFSPWEYLASHGDVLAAFDLDPSAATAHWNQFGRAEGRQITFDGLEYIASYTDLMAALPRDQDAGARHFLQWGRGEGRQIGFDALEYIASYTDLTEAFGANIEAGARHFIRFGRYEARTISFDGLSYIASYPDLIGSYGTNSDNGVIHFIYFGRSEEREVLFDPVAYLSKYADLRAAFGNNVEAATSHYIQYGFAEGRFDSLP